MAASRSDRPAFGIWPDRGERQLCVWCHSSESHQSHTGWNTSVSRTHNCLPPRAFYCPYHLTRKLDILSSKLKQTLTNLNCSFCFKNQWSKLDVKWLGLDLSREGSSNLVLRLCSLKTCLQTARPQITVVLCTTAIAPSAFKGDPWAAQSHIHFCYN